MLKLNRFKLFRQFTSLASKHRAQSSGEKSRSLESLDQRNQEAQNI